MLSNITGGSSSSTVSDPVERCAPAAVAADLPERSVDGAQVLPVLRTYLQLGLNSAAREFLSALPPALREAPEFSAAEAVLARVRPSRVSWSACGGRFRRNLQALGLRTSQAEAISAAWQAAHTRFDLHRAADGNYQVLEREGEARAEPMRMRWLLGLRPHRQDAETRPLAHDRTANTPAPYLFEGLGFGWYFRRVYDVTRDTFLGYSCALYVIEPDLVALAIVLHLHDWSDVIVDPRVHWFCGPAAGEQFEALLRRDIDLMLPKVAVRTRLRPVPPETGAAPVIVRVNDFRVQRADESALRMQQQYAGRDVHYWARRFRAALEGSGPPLRILSFVSRHTTFLQYSMRDARRAFESLGCQHRVITERSDHHGIAASRYHDEVADFDPDLFFIIDHFRRGHESRLPENLPILTWDQDGLPHALNREGMARVGPLDVVVGMTKQSACLRFGLPPHKYLTAAMPANPHEFSAAPMSADELAPHRCDVSYVSNQSQTPRAYHEHESRSISDAGGQRLLEQLYRLIEQSMSAGELTVGPRAVALIERAERQAGAYVQNAPMREWILTWYVWRVMDRFYRHQALEWVADWCDRRGRSFHLYGRGWDQHPRLGRYARGVAANGAELRAIYQASTINLQIFPAGFIHQRAMDGLAAGGFFLARRSPADFNGLLVKAICRRCDKVDITSTRAMLSSADDELRAALEAFRRVSGDPLPDDGQDKLAELRIQSELSCAAECFPRFGEIVFDSADSFASIADRFIDQPALRTELAAGMRQVVLSQFTYETTMRKFLEFTRDYLQAEAGRTATR
ncbi:MAG TPA: glycosyltransferase [Phycisphaerae bacterium]